MSGVKKHVRENHLVCGSVVHTLAQRVRKVESPQHQRLKQAQPILATYIQTSHTAFSHAMHMAWGKSSSPASTHKKKNVRMSNETGLEEVSRPFATGGLRPSESPSHASLPRKTSVRFPSRKLSKFDAKGKWHVARLKYKMSKGRRETEALTLDEQESDRPRDAPAPVIPRKSENQGVAFDVDDDEGIAPHLRGGDRQSMTIRFAIRRGTVRMSSRLSSINSRVSSVSAGSGSRLSLSRFRPPNNKPANRSSNADRASRTTPGTTTNGATRLFTAWRPWSPSPSPHDPQSSVVV